MSDKIHNYFFGQQPELPWKKENKMNKKEMKEELVEQLREGIATVVRYQDRPWTFVKLRIKLSHGEELETHGFSKVCRPDKWDAEYGVELAITKALYKLAKEILAKGE